MGRFTQYWNGRGTTHHWRSRHDGNPLIISVPWRAMPLNLLTRSVLTGRLKTKSIGSWMLLFEKICRAYAKVTPQKTLPCSAISPSTCCAMKPLPNAASKLNGSRRVGTKAICSRSLMPCHNRCVCPAAKSSAPCQALKAATCLASVSTPKAGILSLLIAPLVVGERIKHLFMLRASKSRG
jgi:hypothetical protein